MTERNDIWRILFMGACVKKNKLLKNKTFYIMRDWAGMKNALS